VDAGGGRPALTWRLLVTDALDGPTNMAVDEALLRARIAGTGPPTVRLYGWQPATVSLGYGQPLDGTVDLAQCAALGIGVVRRPTGGSAILHEPPGREVTYSVVARADDVPGGDDVLETYHRIGRGLVRGLAHLGAAVDLVPLARDRRGGAPPPAFCFRRAGAYEVAVGGRKLVGSAQRRQRGGFLQHGTVAVDADPSRIRAVFPGEDDPLARMTTLALVLGRRPPFGEVVAALALGLEGELGVRLTPAGLSAAETSLVQTLVAEKYATEAWTRTGQVRGRLGAAGPAAGVAC
jgi:lipoate-protein ligase A